MITGRCECGKVQFEIDEIRNTITACHCKQCRRTSGHFWASTQVSDFKKVQFIEEAGLTWFASSNFATRGFCKFCGSSLFYRLNDEEGGAIAAGCLDEPTNTKLDKHIFVKDKGDYYDIEEDLTKIEKF